MKVGIVDADLLDHGTRHPNLALMKISGYLRDHDHETTLLLDEDIQSCLTYKDLLDRYDKVVISKVFDFSRLPDIFTDAMIDESVMRQGADFGDYLYQRRSPRIVYGGTGFIPLLNGQMPNRLPLAIEHQHLPDYSLYDRYVAQEIAVGKQEKHYDDYRYYSIGFATRGCFRGCKFCVNRGYRYVEAWSPVDEFLDASRPYIYLWDDNFLGLKNHALPFEGNELRPNRYRNTWNGILDDLERTKKPFQFRQGLDIRLMDEEIAERFSSCHYHGDFIFAFDHYGQRKLITDGLEIWKRYNPKNIPKFYVLCGFGNQGVKDIQETFERIRILMTYGALPYIMRHLDYKKSKYAGLYVQIARWCNQPQFFKKKSFRQFCEACQQYHEKVVHQQKKYCSAQSALMAFECDYPDVARRYFDMRWEELRDTWRGAAVEYYQRVVLSDAERSWGGEFGPGLWVEAYRQRNYPVITERLVTAYLTGKSPASVIAEDSRGVEILEWFLSAVEEIPIIHIAELVRHAGYVIEESVENAPQISSYDDSTRGILSLLSASERTLDFEEIGYHLNPNGRVASKVANIKFGENCSKFAALLDLVEIPKKKTVTITSVGRALNRRVSDKIIPRLFFRIALFRDFVWANDEKSRQRFCDTIGAMSASTKARRASAISAMYKRYCDAGGSVVDEAATRKLLWNMRH